MALDLHQQIIETINKSKRPLIIFRKNFSLDSVASAIALSLILKKIDKVADIVATDFIFPKTWTFLPNLEIKQNISDLQRLIVSLDIEKTGIDQFSYNIEGNTLNIYISPKKGSFNADDIKTKATEFKYDLIIILDSPDLESLGDAYANDTQFFFHTPIINIDHNPANENFGQINYVDTTAVSTTEIIYHLFSTPESELLDGPAASCILAGMINETKSFKTHNVTPRALTTAKHCIELGADRQNIVKQLYRTQTMPTLKLWGRVLARLKSDLAGKLVWSLITENDFIDSEANPENLSGVIDELISSLPQAEVAIIFYQQKGSVFIKTEVLRNFNALLLTKKYKGQGDKMITEFSLPQYSIVEAEKEVIVYIKEEIEKLSSV